MALVRGHPDPTERRMVRHFRQVSVLENPLIDDIDNHLVQVFVTCLKRPPSETGLLTRRRNLKRANESICGRGPTGRRSWLVWRFGESALAKPRGAGDVATRCKTGGYNAKRRELSLSALLFTHGSKRFAFALLSSPYRTVKRTL